MKVFESFKQIKWYEYLINLFFSAVLVVLGCVFDSTALVIVNSVVSVLFVYFSTKGMVLGPIFGIVNNILYCIISAQCAYWGELIIASCITIPMCALSLYTWIRNLNKQEQVINISNMKWKEVLISALCVAGVSVGLYFVLRAFNTANLEVSTLSMAISIFASYLFIRRNEYNFVFYIIANFVGLALWILIIIQSDISQIPTAVSYIVFNIYNVYGVVNWARLKRKQKTSLENQTKEKENERI